jgi:phosphatidylinositol alpha-mannosyltransferase
MSENRKLKVGLVFDDSLDSADGVAQYVKTLGAWLSTQGHEVGYLVGQTKLTEWQGGQVYSLAKNLKVRFNGNRLSMPALSRKAAIKRVLEGQKFDVLHVMMPYSPVMAQRLIKYAPKGAAIVGTFHIFPSGNLSKAGSRLLKTALRSSLKRFGEIVAVSGVSADFAKSSYGLNASVIPNPVDIKRFSASKKKPEPSAKPQILFLGRLVKRKGAAQLIEAFKLLQPRLPQARLSIAGRGPEIKKLESQVKRYGLENKVKFLGYIQEADKPRILQAADIACFPSLYGEAFGIVLVEAMAASSGIVLGGDNPGYRSVLGDQPLLLVNPKDTAAFAERLEMLLSDKARVAELHNWQAQAVKQYDINIVGQQIMSMYLRAIAKRAKTSHNVGHGIPKSNG